MVIDYKQGKIYRLVGSGKTYIGSTCQPLHKRKFQHKSAFLRWKNGYQSHATSYDLFEDGFDPDIVLLESCPCNTKEELHARERHWIESMECVNKQIPTRTRDEYMVDNKEKFRELAKQYRKDNLEKYIERKHNYYYSHQDEILQKKKEYDLTHKDIIKEKGKLYREKNDEIIKAKKKQKVICECGVSVCSDKLPRHKKSLSHVNFVLDHEVKVTYTNNHHMNNFIRKMELSKNLKFIEELPKNYENKILLLFTTDNNIMAVIEYIDKDIYDTKTEAIL